ncbi:putative lipoprotein [Leptospira santarosai str. AIM]|uniref:Lipoprotein n=1 Tax=Leptospira santarosai serovar Shermani str. LT 821 TaxID=758847 RepID=K8XW35_9LEPT|nr:hypothetical protein LSS_16086 [Leptospira santarosai serovar Shermani str. LT 821]EMO83162.1 putative lipoprotein [Leptospira santarosai str. AIM]EPG83560.1 putative lipoprotein [Leptospira santarosai serovar Shermani str. 1342KT]
MYNYKKIIMLLTLILLVSCESLKKDKEDEVSITDPEGIFLIGFGVKWDTLTFCDEESVSYLSNSKSLLYMGFD